MAEQNNKYSIKGTIYDKVKQVIAGKKDPTQSYDKFTITLEVTSTEERSTKEGTKFSTNTEFPQFEAFNPTFDVNSFIIGDFVEVWFYLSGKKFTYRSGERAGKEGIITRNPITYIKYADIDNNNRPYTKDSSGDTPERETVFVAPNSNVEDDTDNDLPF